MKCLNLFAVAACLGSGLALVSCGVGADDLPADDVSTLSESLLTCTNTIALNGSAGDALPGGYIAAVQASGTNVLTVTYRNTVSGAKVTTQLTLGTGITATGTVGHPDAVGSITGVRTDIGSSTIQFLGAPGIGGTLTFSGVVFGHTALAFTRLAKISASTAGSGTLAVRGTEGVGGGSVDFFNPACGLTASISGGTGIVDLSANVTGANRVSFSIDTTNAGIDTTPNPFLVSFDTRTLTNGVHQLRAFASDTVGGGQRAVSAPVSFTASNDKTGPTATASATGTSGTILLSATNVSDPSGVAQVQFLINDIARGTPLSAPPYTLSFDSRILKPNNTYTLKVKATDSLGNVSTSAGFNFTTNNDFTGPSFDAPTASGSAGVVTYAVANVTDASPIDRVEFRVGSVLIGTDTAAPYALSFDTRFLTNALGTTLSAKAFDAFGQSTEKHITVAIANSQKIEVEQNGTLATANVLSTANDKVLGFLAPATDLDFYRLTVQPGRTLVVQMRGPDAKDYNLALLDAAGTQLASSTNAGTSTESISFTNSGTASVDWSVKVSAVGTVATTTAYHLAINR